MDPPLVSMSPASLGQFHTGLSPHPHDDHVRGQGNLAVQFHGEPVAGFTYGGGAAGGMHLYTGVQKLPGNLVAIFVVKGLVQQLGQHLHDMDLDVAAPGQFISELGPDEASAQNHYLGGLAGLQPELLHGRKALYYGVDPGQFYALHRRQHRAASRGQNQPAVKHLRPRGQGQASVFGIKRDGLVNLYLNTGVDKRLVTQDILGGIIHGVDHVGNGAGDDPVPDFLDDAH